MSKYFSKEYGPTFYVVLGTICAVLPLLAFFVGYLCVRAGEYWPLLWCATVTVILWWSAYYSFRTARVIKQSRNRPKDEV
jgi:hypothetical protein